MRSLADTRNPYILQRYGLLTNEWRRAAQETIFFLSLRYLDATLDRDKIRPQDVTSVLSGVARNPAGSQLAWRHVQINWKDLLDKFGTGSFIMGSIIETTTSHFSSEFDYR